MRNERKNKNATLVGVALGLALGMQAIAGAAATLTLTPALAVIGVDGAGQVRAIYDPDGAGLTLPSVLDAASVIWSSDHPSIVSISNKAVLKGLSAGSATITGVYNGLTAVQQVTVAGQVVSNSLSTPDGRTRSYLLYIPSSYNSSARVPLVLDLHGGGGSAQNQINLSLLNNVSNAQGFIVAYPNGTGTPLETLLGTLTWNGGGCCGYAMTNHVDDVTFIKMAISDVASHYSIDTDHVYATGLSNGGIMVQRLACGLSDKIAAVAPVSGGINMSGDFSTCAPARAVPIMEFHGTTDQYYPYLGGVGQKGLTGEGTVNFYPIPNTITGWLNRYRIPSSAKTVSYQNGIETCETYTAGASTLKVTLCTANPPVVLQNSSGAFVDGGGHAPPGGVVGGYAGADFPTTDLFAAQAMWDFFKTYSLAAPTTPTPPAATSSFDPKFYPNPFHPKDAANISFYGLTPDTRLRIYTVTGALVQERSADSRGALTWDGKNTRNEFVASGVYFGLIESSQGKKTVKIVIER